MVLSRKLRQLGLLHDSWHLDWSTNLPFDVSYDVQVHIETLCIRVQYATVQLVIRRVEASLERGLLLLAFILALILVSRESTCPRLENLLTTVVLVSLVLLLLLVAIHF